MASELRSIRPAPVQTWGTNHAEYQRARRAESRPVRTCATCPAYLSKFNPAALCGPCAKREWDTKMTKAAQPGYVPEIKRCGWCRSSFKARSKDRRVCYVCIPKAVSV